MNRGDTMTRTLIDMLGGVLITMLYWGLVILAMGGR